MPYLAQTRDLSTQYLGYDRDEDDFRPIATTPGAVFTPGFLCNLATMDVQIYPDEVTIQPCPIAAGQGLFMGVVSDTWPGFSGSVTPNNYTAPTSSTLTRGTVGVTVVLRGFHPAVYVDQSGGSAVTITNSIPIVGSSVTIGYGQGVAKTTAASNLGVAAIAMLPASGLGSSLTAAALAQAAATTTIAGTPTTGDVYTFNMPAPYTTTSPGVAPLQTFVQPALTVSQAASVTTAAAASVTFLNAQPGYSRYWTATSSAGVITHTVNALATPFLVTFGSGSTLTNSFSISLSGMQGNTASGLPNYTVSVAGVSTITATTQFTGGTGYKGTIPAYVTPS